MARVTTVARKRRETAFQWKRPPDRRLPGCAAPASPSPALPAIAARQPWEPVTYRESTPDPVPASCNSLLRPWRGECRGRSASTLPSHSRRHEGSGSVQAGPSRAGYIRQLLIDGTKRAYRISIVASWARFRSQLRSKQRSHGQGNHRGVKDCGPHPRKPRCNGRSSANDPQSSGGSVDLRLQCLAPTLDKGPDRQQGRGGAADDDQGLDEIECDQILQGCQRVSEPPIEVFKEEAVPTEIAE